jgi:hypothetical protein
LWLKFNEGSLTFSGKSTEINVYVIRVKAIGYYHASFYLDFELEIYNEPLLINTNIDQE